MRSGKSSNPVGTLWNVLGTIGGIISLSTFAEDLFEKALHWKGFIANVIDAYRSIVNPVADFLFGWLPFALPFLVTNYLILGMLISASVGRGIASYSHDPQFTQVHVPSVFQKMRVWVVSVVSWPLVVLMVLLGSILPLPESDAERRAYRRGMRLSIRWFVAMILGLVILLAINAQIGNSSARQAEADRKVAMGRYLPATP